MTATPVIKAASGGLTRHLVQTLVIIIVLAAATAATLLGVSLLTNANEAFTNGFNAHHGADISLTVNTSRVTTAQLAATRHVTGVIQVAGPYPELAITCRQNGGPGPLGAPGGKPAGGPRDGTGGKPGKAAGGAGESQITVLGRTSAGGPLDDLVMNQGHWLTGPGQLVMAVYHGGGTIGSNVSVVSAPGKPKLTIVGAGGSVARLGDEDGWVTSGEVAALTPPGAHPMAQMLYTFSKASTALQIAADVSALKAALPAGAVISYDSWLGAEGQTSGEQSVNTPFVLAFALIGLVLAVLIVAPWSAARWRPVTGASACSRASVSPPGRSPPATSPRSGVPRSPGCRWEPWPAICGAARC